MSHATRTQSGCLATSSAARSAADAGVRLGVADHGGVGLADLTVIIDHDDRIGHQSSERIADPLECRAAADPQRRFVDAAETSSLAASQNDHSDFHIDRCLHA